VNDVKEGQKYKHFRTQNLYEFVGISRHSETLEELVIYKALYETNFGYGSLWVRPKSMFFEKVIHEGKLVLRFQPVD
jgi:cyclomaltodextrinase